jgi:4-hydroxy-4-methyl-2-oxoglutarate aldolase
MSQHRSGLQVGPHGGVRLLEPGDLIFRDREGVLVIAAQVEGEAVADTVAKMSEESKVAIAIRGGTSAREAFERFGVL